VADAPFYYIYGVPAETQDADRVHVERVLDRSLLHHGKVEPHCHPHLYQLSLWSGSGSYQFAGRDQLLHDRTLTIMPPNVVHGFVIAPPTNALVVSMSASFVAELRTRFGGEAWAVLDTPELIELAPDPAMRLDALFATLEEEIRFHGRHSHSAIGCQLQLIAILVDRLLWIDRPSLEDTADDCLLRSFLRLLDEKFRERWQSERYAAALGTTPYLLNRATSGAFGKTSSEVVRERTLIEAKRLLLFSKASAGEVGYMLGFGDPAHFGRFFQRALGLSPSMWRRRQIDRAIEHSH
jgi:AraC family transcriptional regulator, transcriptional activator of pobA